MNLILYRMHKKIIPFVRLHVISVAALCAIIVLGASTVIAAISSGTSTTNSSIQVITTQLTLSKPTVSTGDVMIAGIAINGGMAAVVTAPSGWTQIARTDNDKDVSLISYYKVVDGSESSTYTWSIDGQTTAEGGITPYSSVDTASPIDAAAGNTGFSKTATTSTITTTINNTQIIALFATDVGRSNNAPYFSTVSGMTEKYDVNNAPFGPSIAFNEVIQSTAGTAESKSSTISGNRIRNWTAQQIALKPAPHDCTGGTITHVGGNTIHTFIGNGHLTAPTQNHKQLMFS